MPQPLRSLAPLLGVLFLLFACAEPAEAHGGRFQGPPPTFIPPTMVPPGGRVPGAPLPRGGITPRGPITPRVPGGPVTGGPGGGVTPGFRAPPTTPGTGSSGPTAPLSGGSSGGGPSIYRPGRRPTTVGSDPNSDWQTWWALNRWAFLPERERVVTRRLTVVTPSSTDGVTEPVPDDDPIAAWNGRRSTIARMIVPRLMALLEPGRKTNPDVLASALLAVARVAQTGDAVDAVLHHAEDRSAPVDVRGSAALALGLFRRTDPALRLDGLTLDLVRRHLLDLIDQQSCPTPARAMAALALGLLADQPYGTTVTREGRIVVKALWERLNAPHASAEIPIAILTALGHQLPAGVPESVLEGLKDIALGRRVEGIRWSNGVRAHALAARLRLRGPGFEMLLVRTLTSTRSPLEVRRAAFLGLAQCASALDAEERRAAHSAWWKAIRTVRDPFTGGLAYIALGRLLAADRAADPDAALVAEAQGVPTLLAELGRAKIGVRGFVAIALGLALGAEGGDSRVAKLRAKAGRTLQRYLEKRQSAASVHPAYIVALGLIGSDVSVTAIARILADRTEPPELRRHAAIALAQIGKNTPDVRAALAQAIRDDRAQGVSEDAALALALLGSAEDGRAPLDGITERGTHAAVGQLALALGRLGDLRAVGPLRAIAEDESHLAENRALAVASLGLLLDPERPPSLSRLQVDALYPVRSATLHQVYDLL